MSHDVCPECCQAMVHLGAASAGLTEIFHGFPTSDSDSADQPDLMKKSSLLLTCPDGQQSLSTI